MKFQDLIKNLEAREGKRKSYDFKRMKALLEVLENPHKSMKYLHVAGTNGKGSVSNFLYNMLMSEGYEVGLYTSPHLERYTERIKISGEEISQEDFEKIGTRVLQAEEKIVDEFEMLTYFETITAIAFIYFKEKNCSYCVLEVGMGGLSDSTNLVDVEDKILSVITPIAMDHMQYLGNTIEEIARQKAGIIKNRTLCTSSNTDPRIIKVIKDKALEEQAPYLDLNDIEVFDLKIGQDGASYSIKFKKDLIENIKINLRGYYQFENSLLSLLSILELRNQDLLVISDESIKKGLNNTFWPGRMELIQKEPKIILDGAHNLNGIEGLTKSLELFDYKKLYVITSILSDKEHEKMLEKLAKPADQIVLVSLNTKRKSDLDLLKREAEKYCQEVYIIDNLKEAIKESLQKLSKEDMLLISGSLYLVSETKELIKEVLE